MTNLQNKVVEVARSLLYLPQSKFKHFTFICERNKIVCTGFNTSFKTHTIAHKFGHRFSCIHSELSAINCFKYKLSLLSKYRIINVRIHADGSLGNSRPCIHCQYMLSSFGIRRIMYSTKNGFVEETLNGY